MPKSNELSIDESTLERLVKFKKEAGFGDKTWDEWFNFVFTNKFPPTQTKIE
jgi:hypothetical protein